MEQEKIFKESSANRDHNMGYYESLCAVYASKAFGQDREFGGCTMAWDYFEATSYKRDYDDLLIKVYIDFNTNTIKVTTIK